MSNMKKETLEKVITWFTCANTGASSEAIAGYLTTGAIGYCSTPSDPSDFNRCLMLLDAIPELKEDMHKMKNLGRQWPVLIDSWDIIEKSFIDEVGLNWCHGGSAPKTYKLMKSIGL